MSEGDLKDARCAGAGEQETLQRTSNSSPDAEAMRNSRVSGADRDNTSSDQTARC